jgi:alginate O-acetyltransferase complex protein AlgI
MVFSSLIFLYLFLPAVLLVSLVGGTKVRNITLLFASLVFYCWAGPTLIIYLAISILLNYLFGLLIAANEKRARAWFITGIVFNVLFLLTFKYTGFFITTLCDIAGHVWIKNPNLPFIVGISFFTFQAMTYLIDVKRKISPATRDLVKLALYISFFPKLIAGPITRYHLMEGQIQERKISFDLFGEGARRFVLGLARKVLIANQLALIADNAFSLQPLDLTPGIAWIGLIAYTLQIYHDFAGYTDMAIGLGLMFGFRLPENFNFPYISRTVTEFWKRWHITLSEWFRDYLFLPLAYRFSRLLPKERYWMFRADQVIYLPAAMITFLLCGLWHGSAWGFVIWGGIHGLFISIERIGLSRLLKKMPTLFSHLYLLFVVTVAWVFFRSSSLAESFTYIQALFGLMNSGSTAAFISYYDFTYLVVGLIAAISATPLPAKLRSLFMKDETPFRGSHVWRIAGLAVMVFLLAFSTYYLVNSTYSSFIYFKF